MKILICKMAVDKFNMFWLFLHVEPNTMNHEIHAWVFELKKVNNTFKDVEMDADED